MASITIRGNVLDPAKPGNIALLPDVSKTKYVLVQLKNEMSQSSFKILKDNGLEPFKRMDGNTWLCHHTTSDFTKVRGLSIVQYVLAYLAYFKVHLSLKTPTTTGDRLNPCLNVTNLRQDLAKIFEVLPSYFMRVLPHQMMLLIKSKSFRHLKSSRLATDYFSSRLIVRFLTKLHN